MPDFGPLVVPGEDLCGEVQRPAPSRDTARVVMLGALGDAGKSLPGPSAYRSQAWGSGPAQADSGPNRHWLRPWAKVSKSNKKSSCQSQSLPSSAKTSRSEGCSPLHLSLVTQRIRPARSSPKSKDPAPTLRQPEMRLLDRVARFLSRVRSGNASPPSATVVPLLCGTRSCLSSVQSPAEVGRSGIQILPVAWEAHRTLFPTEIYLRFT